MSVCCREVSSIRKQLPQEDLQLVQFTLEKYMYIYIFITGHTDIISYGRGLCIISMVSEFT